MPATIRRSRTQVLTALAVLLALPTTTLAADEGDWGFRQAFRTYVYNGPGTMTAAAGATCDPNPDAARGGCDPQLGATTDVFGWTASDATYALPDGDGTIDLQGTVTFVHPMHLFTMTIVDPVVTIATDGTAIVSLHVTIASDFPAVPDHDSRMDFGAFDLTSLEVTASTVTWRLGNGAVTTEAATALGGFLTAGAALDPIRVVLPRDEQPVPTSTPTPTPTTTPGPERVCGDADGNGRVSVTDGVNVLRTAAGLSGACADPAPCDVDGNGAVSVTDGVNVLRAAAGLVVDFQCFDLE